MDARVTQAIMLGMQPVVVIFHSNLMTGGAWRQSTNKTFAVELNNRAFVLGTWLAIDDYLLEQVRTRDGEIAWDDLRQRNGADYLQKAIDKLSS